ncbi:hypothetical protein OH77DRAFT_1422074, partial [Trametes cingulata]
MTSSTSSTIDGTLGAFMLGHFIGVILYGVSLHQAYRYCRMYPGDSRWLKGLVALALFLETIASIMSMDVCYYYLVTNRARPQTLLDGV